MTLQFIEILISSITDIYGFDCVQALAPVEAFGSTDFHLV